MPEEGTVGGCSLTEAHRPSLQIKDSNPNFVDQNHACYLLHQPGMRAATGNRTRTFWLEARNAETVNTTAARESVANVPAQGPGVEPDLTALETATPRGVPCSLPVRYQAFMVAASDLSGRENKP